jgi:hypothetical protein
MMKKINIAFFIYMFLYTPIFAQENSTSLDVNGKLCFTSSDLGDKDGLYTGKVLTWGEIQAITVASNDFMQSKGINSDEMKKYGIILYIFKKTYHLQIKLNKYPNLGGFHNWPSYHYEIDPKSNKIIKKTTT